MPKKISGFGNIKDIQQSPTPMPINTKQNAKISLTTQK